MELALDRAQKHQILCIGSVICRLQGSFKSHANDAMTSDIQNVAREVDIANLYDSRSSPGLRTALPAAEQ